MAKVVIDPGHGPSNGNKGPTMYYEHAGMYKLSCYLRDELTARGVTVIMTRTDKSDPALDVRGAMAKGADLFISQHSNAANKTARGCEVFYSIKNPASKAVAAAISAASAKLMGNNDRGAKMQTTVSNGATVDYFGVIRNAAAVGCKFAFLVESGFHDNVTDEAWLLKDANLKALAKVQADIICNAIGVKLVTKTPEEITVDNMVSDGVTTDTAYWLNVLKGQATASASNIKAILDKYHNKIKG